MSDLDSVILMIPGFTQNVGKRIGFNKLWRSLHREFDTDETAVLAPIAWNQPMDHWAGFVRDVTSAAQIPRIFVVAYSWGCGWGFQQVSKYLESWSIDIECAVLCDPVYKSRWKLMALRSMITKDMPVVGHFAPVIKIRKNVMNVHSFYQVENRPRAHKLVAMDPKRTTIHERAQLFKPHEAMDDHPHFHKKVHDVFGELLEEKDVA